MGQEEVVVLAFPSQCPVESCSVLLDCTCIINRKNISILFRLPSLKTNTNKIENLDAKNY